MREIGVVMSVTLDGVTQGLARPDEDTRDGFGHGGWGPRYMDDVMGREMGQGMSRPGDMLLGRRTWEDFIGAWSHETDGNPFTDHMNKATKYVVSRTLTNADEWQNSILLRGDAVENVRALKADGDRPLAIIGSTALVRALHAAGLVDRYTLLIHPLVLGGGARLFDETSPVTEFTLDSCVPTTTGVLIANYIRARNG